ncbi:Uncharacterised protein [Candidatus Burarchaeum australiense]|nr:Uncharacterised protein [Candidatus Burarchaeum australiense]
MVENKKSKFLEALRAIESSPDAKEMHERLAAIAKRIKEAKAGTAMKDIYDDLGRTMRVLNKNPGLKALFGLRAKMLLEEVEFKRTGRRVIID